MNPKTILAAFALAGGCATTTEPPPELVRARNDYQMAANGPAAQLDPSSLYTARKHLDRAELAYADTPNDPWVRDQAYIADRKALFADAQARMLLAQRQEATARAQLADMAESATLEMRKARAASQRATAQLEAERRALEEARRRGEVTAGELAEREAELSEKEAELEESVASLAAEREARLAAEEARAEAEARSRVALDELARTAQVVEEERGVVITLSGQVLFASGKSTLLPAARDALDNVAEALKASPDRDITVEGHTDALGSEEFNLDLSQRRADAVREYLVSQGVDAEIIKAQGVGEDEPVTSNATPEGRANNRRVEIVLSPLELK